MATKIEIIVENNLERWKEKVNALSKELNAFATQTHVTESGGSLFFTAILFYKSE